jgi:two-component system sensor histidine kinase KdpD
MNDNRPDPDLLLAQVQQTEARARRGRLTIFFGANAGVGKTYWMSWSATSSCTAVRKPSDCSSGSNSCRR